MTTPKQQLLEDAVSRLKPPPARRGEAEDDIKVTVELLERVYRHYDQKSTSDLRKQLKGQADLARKFVKRAKLLMPQLPEGIDNTPLAAHQEAERAKQAVANLPEIFGKFGYNYNEYLSSVLTMSNEAERLEDIASKLKNERRAFRVTRENPNASFARDCWALFTKFRGTFPERAKRFTTDYYEFCNCIYKLATGKNPTKNIQTVCSECMTYQKKAAPLNNRLGRLTLALNHSNLSDKERTEYKQRSQNLTQELNALRNIYHF